MTGPELRAALRSLGLTVTRFAVEIGRGRRTVQRWLKGGMVPAEVARRVTLSLGRGYWLGPSKPRARSGAALRAVEETRQPTAEEILFGKGR